MRIPDIQYELRAMARAHGIERLGELADALSRRPPPRRARPVSTPMTPELRSLIRLYAEGHPELTQVEVGREFGVNQGRVSEALNGKRK